MQICNKKQGNVQQMYIRRGLFIIRMLFASIRKKTHPDFLVSKVYFCKKSLNFSQNLTCLNQF